MENDVEKTTASCRDLFSPSPQDLQEVQTPEVEAQPAFPAPVERGQVELAGRLIKKKKRIGKPKPFNRPLRSPSPSLHAHLHGDFVHPPAALPVDELEVGADEVVALELCQRVRHVGLELVDLLLGLLATN